jgi:hypothetical protein
MPRGCRLPCRVVLDDDERLNDGETGEVGGYLFLVLQFVSSSLHFWLEMPLDISFCSFLGGCFL